MPTIYRTAEDIADIVTDLASARLVITQIQSALQTSGATSGTSSYTFGSSGGTGIQKEVFVSATELIDALRIVTATRDRLKRMRDGTTNQSVRFRRP